MATTVNNNNIESKNRVINYDIEIVRDFDGTYYVNARNELHEHIKGLPEYLPYKELKKAVKEALGVTLPPLKSLTFEGNGRKQYANAYGLQGIEIHQEPLAFGLQDKVVLGSFGESRPYAIGCTVTGYRWDSEAGEFLYILQGEDGKQYTGFARNIISDNGNDPKAERQERYNARCKELEAEALAQMPYKVGDTVTSRYGDTGRVIEMHPEITGDIDNPHLIYEYDGKPTVNVVILDADGKRHCAHWSVYTLEPASEIKAVEHKVTPEVINAHMKALKELDSQKKKAPAYAVGTRVLCKAYGVMGTVKENNYLYKVEYDSPVDRNGHTYTYGIYGEYGITTSYDKQGREIVGNANYYAYELTASYWGEWQPRLFHLAGLDITATQHGLVWQVTAKDGDGEINRYAIMQTEELAAYLAELYAKEHMPTAKKEAFGKMFIYRLYIKWKWMQQRFERIGDMDRAAYCFYHRLRLTKLYIYQPGWRIMDYGDMKPIFFPRQRIK
jgi:hypothetical protein